MFVWHRRNPAGNSNIFRLMGKLFTLLLIISATLISVQAQQPTKAQTFTLHGTIKDPKGAVIDGLRIVKKGTVAFNVVTDINGEFKIDLDVGDHVLTIEPETLYDFRAFIRITEKGPNPDNVDFVVDPSRVCCDFASNPAFPDAVSLPKPAYPPAARAVRARGKVIVAVKIDRDGKIITAKAMNGHPLLRAAAEVAARSSLFKSSDDATGGEREARITYDFITYDEKLRAGLSRYTNRLTVEIIAPEPVF